MSKYRRQLPQLLDTIFMTDGGLETTLVFEQGLDLPHFAAFDLLKDRAGRDRLRSYFETYARIARRHRRGIVMESPTWRASADWGRRLGYGPADLDAFNRKAIALLVDIRNAWETASMPIVISGNLGPRGDGYRPSMRMTARAAEAYHAPQVASFAATAADMVAAFTMNYPEEAIGIARAARAADMPVAISFTVETDGDLPSGDRLRDAIELTDQATDSYPAYYMINCAHPAHFEHVLREEGTWRERIRGVRANASRRSHAELDESTELDPGDPGDLAARYRELLMLLPRLSVVGGCCGTDHRHIDAIGCALAVPA